MILPVLLKGYDCYLDAQDFINEELPEIKSNLISAYTKKIVIASFKKLHFSHTEYVKECVKKQNTILGVALVQVVLDNYADNPDKVSENIYDVFDNYDYSFWGAKLENIFSEAVIEESSEDVVFANVELMLIEQIKKLDDTSKCLEEPFFDNSSNKENNKHIKNIIPDKYKKKAEKAVESTKNVVNAAVKSAKPAAEEFYKSFKELVKKVSEDDEDKDS